MQNEIKKMKIKGVLEGSKGTCGSHFYSNTQGFL